MNENNGKQGAFAWVAVGLLAVGIASCGEVDLETTGNSESPSEEVSQSAKVTPEFAIRGLDDVPEEMKLEELGLAVAEIRLEPLRGEEGFVYATSEPFSLTFDLAEGEDVLRGETVEFPETGRFLVSIRIEPADEGEVDDALYEGSFGIRGKVRRDYAVELSSEDDRRSERELSDDDSEDDDEEYDGNPLPLPAERPSYEETMWTPFTLTSNRAVAYTYSDVELAPGEQVLTFEFHVQDWARDAAAPIADAVHDTESDDIVDVGGEIDSPTSEPEALLGTGSVSTGVY